jgi:nucleotide-binding universal stress UspA family protein
MAEQVRVVTVTNEKTLDSRRSGAAVSKYLAAHGLTASLDVVDAADRSIGEVLESYALSLDADLLVMGAYGHSRVRDFILGGATKSMLARPPLPVLLSH